LLELRLEGFNFHPGQLAHLFVFRVLGQLARAGEFVVERLPRTILLDNLAQAAMLFGGFAVR